MRKKANPASTLLVVATAEPDNYFNKKQDLALYTDNEGNDYITNAGLAEHASPYTGEMIKDAGTPVTVELDPEQALAIPCETCETVTLMDIEQASALDEHKITCVACGSSMEFEVEDDDAVEAADDEDEDDDADEASEEASDDDDEDDDAEEASDEEDDDEEASDDDDDEDDEDRPLDLVEFDDDDDDEDDEDDDADDEKSCKANAEDDDEDDAEEASDDDDEDDEEEASFEEDDDVIEIVEAKKSKTKGARKAKPSKMKKSKTDDDDSDEDEACDTKDDKACDEKASDSDDTDEATTDDESEEAKTGETELVDVALASLVEGNVTLIPLEGTKVGAFVGDVCVATINEGADNYDLLETASYGRGLGQAIKNVGIVAALNDAGFDLVVIKASTALANAGKVSEEIIAHKVEERAGVYADRLRNCMDIVAAGGIRGLFTKSGIGILANTLEAKLTSLNVGNAKAVTKEVLTQALPRYSNGVLEEAHELLQKPDAVIESLAEQIASMDPTAFDYKSESLEANDKEENIVEAKLRRPARASETASVAKPSHQPERPFMGLFNN